MGIPTPGHQASRHAPPKKVGGEEDEAAWAALEDAEKAVALALRGKLKGQQQPLRQGVEIAQSATKTDGQKRPSARREAPARTSGGPVGGNGTLDGPSHVTAGSPRGSVKRDAAGVQKMPALKGMVPPVTSTAAAHLRSKYSMGSKVEYWSKKQRKWLTASVTAVHTGKKGTVPKYDLDCKKQVPVWRLRAPRASVGDSSTAVADQVFQKGAEVRYWSATVKKWVKAVVQDVHGGTAEQKEITYTLNVKPQVEAAKVRVASTPSNAPPPSSATKTSGTNSSRKRSLAQNAAAKTVDGQDGTRVFQIKDEVEYWSKKSSRWLDAVVEAKREPGGSAPAVYDLRSRKLLIKGATAAWMRRPVEKSNARAAISKPRPAPAVQKRRAHEKAARAATAVYNVGEKIHYWSKKSNSWVLGIVEARSDPSNGMPTLYDLRCKRMLVRGVLAKQLREAEAAAAAAAPAKTSKLDPGSAERTSKRPRVEEPSAPPPAQTSAGQKNTLGESACVAKASGAVAESFSVVSSKTADVSNTGPSPQVVAPSRQDAITS
jgi:hypothetical protein